MSNSSAPESNPIRWELTKTVAIPKRTDCTIKNCIGRKFAPKYTHPMKAERTRLEMKPVLLMILCCATILASGCTAGITRTGYQLPAGQTSSNLPKRPIAIRCEWKYDTNDVVVLGSIHAYDTGFSLDCDEVAILDIFCREGSMLGADIINITEEKQPNPLTSTCYRAKAQFLRFKDREKAIGLVSDAKYAPEAIIERAAKYSRRNTQVLAGAVAGGLLGFVVVAAVTDPNAQTNYYTNSISAKSGKRQ